MRKAFHAIRGLAKAIERAVATVAVAMTPLSGFTRKDDTGASRGRRRPIPTSTAGGGLMPGIDISNSAALQAMDDLGNVQRMKRLD
jgi:hypothetical protein